MLVKKSWNSSIPSSESVFALKCQPIGQQFLMEQPQYLRNTSVKSMK